MNKLFELSNNHINAYFKGNNKYVGCYPKDKLPNVKAKEYFMIINMDNDSGEGTHWVSLYVKPTVCFYFDPFGLPPPENVLKYMNQTKLPKYYSDVDLQSKLSVSCGWWCIYFMDNISKGRKFVDILYDDFTMHPQTNERRLLKYFSNV